MVKREFVTLVSALLLGTAGVSAGTIYNFVNLTRNSAQDLAPQFTMEVTDGGNGRVDFVLRNTGPLSSSITDIQFYNGSWLGISEVENGLGVLFERRETSLEMPATDLGLARLASTSFVAMPQPDTILENGVNPGEQITISFALAPGRTSSDAMSSLDAGAGRGGLWIGLNAQSLADGYVDSFENVAFNRAPIVPLPAGVWMGLALLSAVAGVRYLTKRSYAVF